MAKVLIVSRTKMKNGVCVGGIIESTCEIIRLHNERGGNLSSDAPYKVGDIWEMKVEPAWNARNYPHIEDRQTTPIKHIGNVGHSGVINFVKSHNFGLRFTCGPLQDTFEGCLKFQWGKCFINDCIPSFSTQFWISDEDLVLFHDENYNSDSYLYKGYKIKYVGIKKVINTIPAGTMLRLSLANWWNGDGSGENRCYLQLSGWYDPNIILIL